MRYLIIILVAFGLMSTFAFAQPKLELECGSTYDWGKIKAKDSPAKANIKFFNKGDEMLKIYGVKPGCGCTTAPLDKDSIQPGDYATLSVSLRISSYTGAVSKSITIRSNDPEKRTTILYIKAQVMRAITLSPRFMNFAKAFVGETSNAKITVSNSTDKDITIKEIEISPEGFEINIKEDAVIPAKGQIDIICTYTADKPGRFTGSIKFKTDHPDATRQNIQVYGNAQEKVSKTKAQSDKKTQSSDK